MHRMKPILFNTEMVQANLNGLKSATRRVAFQNEDLRKFPRPDNPDAWWFRGRVYTNWDSAMRSPQGVLSLCRYKKGDILYVRETWCQYGKMDDSYRLIEGTEKYYYRADGENQTPFNDFLVQHPGWDEHREAPVWHPSIHMPKEAARLFLRVTNVRVERLRDITDDGAKAEGANWKHGHHVGVEEKMRRGAVERFAEIWDSTIKPADRDRYGWEANQWVFVIEYERCEKPEELNGTIICYKAGEKRMDEDG